MGICYSKRCRKDNTSGESQVRAPKVYGNSYVVNLSGKRTEYTKVILYMFCRTLMRLWNEDSTVFLFSELKNSREVLGNAPKWCTKRKRDVKEMFETMNNVTVGLTERYGDYR